jgi:hypothetical protein
VDAVAQRQQLLHTRVLQRLRARVRGQLREVGVVHREVERALVGEQEGVRRQDSRLGQHRRGLLAGRRGVDGATEHRGLLEDVVPRERDSDRRSALGHAAHPATRATIDTGEVQGRRTG